MTNAAPGAAARAGIFTGRPLERGERVTVALITGIGAALATFLAFLQDPRYAAKDFTYVWRAGRAVLDGLDPYVVIRPSGPYPFESQYMYPFTTALVSVPFALVPMLVGGALFVGAGTAALVFVRSRDGMGRLWFLASFPFFMNVGLGQWAPLLMAAALATPLGWALACKPTLGAALFLYRPRWGTVVACAALVLLSLAVKPSWPVEWWNAARGLEEHPVPASYLLGLVPLLGLLRWRKPEGRLVAAMALVPQTLYWYDQLPLWLVARDGRSAFALTALSWVSWAVGRVVCHGQFCGPRATNLVLGFLYVPATAMVLLDADGRAAVARWWRRVRPIRVDQAHGGEPNG